MTSLTNLEIANCELRIADSPTTTIRNPKSEIRNARRAGQSTLEYAVFTAVVSAALVAMTLYVRRSIQANLKVLEDQINAQEAG